MLLCREGDNMKDAVKDFSKGHPESVNLLWV